jgi:hypothetical protein
VILCASRAQQLAQNVRGAEAIVFSGEDSCYRLSPTYVEVPSSGLKLVLAIEAPVHDAQLRLSYLLYLSYARAERVA